MTSIKYERRVSERIKVQLLAHWEGEKGRCEGTITDLSMEGCFVLGAGEVTDGELVRLEIHLPKNKVMVLWGVVSNHLEEIGFGMKFTTTGPVETKRLSRMIERATEKNAST
jgi:hypothetical protein